MIRILYLNTGALDDDRIFSYYFAAASAQRKEKAARYLRREDKNLCIGASALINCFLNEQGMEEKDAVYLIGENGKPFFKDLPELHFNISHSGSMVLAAFSEHEIGCDIEKIKSPDLKIAARFFAPEENDYINSFADEKDKAEAFYRLWTLKESFMKVTGFGMKLPFNSFSVDISSTPARLCRSNVEGEFYFGEPEISGEYKAAFCSVSSESSFAVECKNDIFHPDICI